jgi:hypothetical protein
MTTKKLLFARPEWFGRRKYTGWGVSIRTWQGGVYVGAMISLVVLLSALVDITHGYSLYVAGIVFLIFIIEMLYVMTHLNLDERERMHEAIAERNALWGIMMVLIAGVIFELIHSGLRDGAYVNPFVAGALIVGVIIKSATNFWLDKHN